MCKFLRASPQAVWMFILVLWVLPAYLNSQNATSGLVRLQRFGFSKAWTDADVPQLVCQEQVYRAVVSPGKNVTCPTLFPPVVRVTRNRTSRNRPQLDPRPSLHFGYPLISPSLLGLASCQQRSEAVPSHHA